MSKIVSMSSGAIDPIAQTKRVFWRPVTTDTALRTGDPVCYKLDAVDHKERTVDPTHLGLTEDTYAEGSQEMTGRLFSVEEPLIDNIDAFAGIVKSLGPKAGADGDMIEIFVPNGAIVPANVVLTATVAGRTILAVMVGTRTLGSPTKDIPNYGATAGTNDSKVVGIAMETLAAAGLCWVKLDDKLFTHLGGNIGNELQVAAGAVDVTINQMNVDFKLTAGHCQMLHYRAKLSGTGIAHASRGVYRFEAFDNTTGTIATSDAIYGVDTLLDIGAGSKTGYLAPLKATIRTRSADPDLSGAYGVNCLMLEWIMTKTTTSALTNPPPFGSLIYVNSDNGGTGPVYFLHGAWKGSVAMAANAVAADDAAANSIKIYVEGAVYYIPCYTAAEIA